MPLRFTMCDESRGADYNLVIRVYTRHRSDGYYTRQMMSQKRAFYFILFLADESSVTQIYSAPDYRRTTPLCYLFPSTM